MTTVQTELSFSRELIKSFNKSSSISSDDTSSSSSPFPSDSSAYSTSSNYSSEVCSDSEAVDFTNPDDIPRKLKSDETSSSSNGYSSDCDDLANQCNVKMKSFQGITIDHFRLVSVLGRGNYGKVLLAEHRKTGKQVALKTFLKSEIVKNDDVDVIMIERSVLKANSKAAHPFLVNLLACFQTVDHAIFVMDYVPGGDLMIHIQDCIFNEKRTVFSSACVLLALQFLHENMIMYRDLKLDNLLMDREGYIKLGDFGLCKEAMGPDDTTSTFCGTTDFISPEALTEESYTRAIDWWGLGILIYEMLAGECPFTGACDEETFENIVYQKAEIPLRVSISATLIIQRLLEKDPVKRLGSVSGAADIKKETFYSQLNFDDLLARKIKPPIIPQIVNKEDVSNFDREFTNEQVCLSLEAEIRPKSPSVDDYFGDFDYTPLDFL